MQVFKGALSRAGTEETDAMRYFSSTDLADLFKASQEGFESSDTQVTVRVAPKLTLMRPL